ncbi:N-acyl amino acid synthase FeeM domain-containing protein [Dokdonella sp.]|uniref:N-acyl amino acid synthase FeeM domain-containing protein n=1 Tax=Dokdonella sp. TaxID=2291710 RepID=UPI002F401B72
MDMHDVRVVVTPDDLARVGAFRYRIYVEEQGKHAAHADHVARTLIEPLDHTASSIVYYIEREGAVVATMRAEFLDDDARARHAAAFDTFDFMPPSQVMHFTRLMVAPSARSADATPKLLFLGFALAVLKDRCFGLLSCKPELVPVFERYACLQYAEGYIDTECGAQVPMAILGETHYLRERAAPLADWLADHRADSPYTQHVLERIARFHAGRPRARPACRLVA